MAGPAFGTNVGQDFTFLTNIDLSTSQFHFVKLASTGYLVVCTAGKLATGVLQSNEDGSVTVKGSSVRTAGTSKIVAGGTFSAGDLIASDSTGRAVAYTAATVFTGTPYTVSGTCVLGTAVEAGTSGQLTTILLQPVGLAGAAF